MPLPSVNSLFVTSGRTALGRAALGRAAAPLCLRLALGRTVEPAEKSQFGRGFADPAVKMPPLLRGLLAIPRGRRMLRHAAAYAWHWRLAQQDGIAFDGNIALAGNLFTIWTGANLAFLHVEKSAGVALLSWFSQKFHPMQINQDPYRDRPPNLVSRLPCARAARACLIWGHYDVPTINRLDPQRFIFTILREPAARLTSLYHFWRSVDPSKFDPEISFAVGLAHRLSFEDFLNHDDPMLTDLIDNVYIRRLTGLYATGEPHDPLHEAPAAALGRATGVLDGLGFVGISEQLDASARRLADRLGIAPPEGALSGNVSAKNHLEPGGFYRPVSQAPLTPGTVAALERRIGLDRALYAHAVEGFEKA